MTNVIVLYNSDYDPEPPARGVLGRDRSAVSQSAYAVMDGVSAYGFETDIMTVHGPDLADCMKRLQENPPDLVFNLVESLAESSKNEPLMPSLLDMMSIPYTGAPALSLGLCLHKDRSKDILKASGIPTPASWLFREERDLLGAKELLFPLFVKLNHEDASVGITSANVVQDVAALQRRVRQLWQQYKQPVLAESYINGREFNITVLGKGADLQVLPFHEIDFGKMPKDLPHIVSYDAKWDEDSPEYGGTTPVPARDVSDELGQQLREYAMASFRALGLRDYGRVDFRVDAKSGIPMVIDVNPNCDISPDAGVARAAAAMDMDFPALMGTICESALSRHDRSLRAEKELANAGA